MASSLNPSKSNEMKFSVDSKVFKKNWDDVFCNRAFCDCIIVCSPASPDDPPKEIAAHKGVIAQHCPYFRAAFEKDPAARAVVLPPLPQLSFENCEALIKLIYTGRIDISPSDIGRYGDLILAATFLQSQTLSKTLTRIVFTSKDRVIAVFGRLASKELCHEGSGILDSLVEFFEKSHPNAKMLLDKPDFVATVDSAVLHRVLSSPKLVLSEKDVFKVALNWSKTQAEKTGKPLAEVFAPLKDCVQYEKLGFAQIREMLHPTGLFTEPELMQMYLKSKPQPDNSLRNPIYMPFEWEQSEGLGVTKTDKKWTIMSQGGGSRWCTTFATRAMMPGCSTITAQVVGIGGCGWICLGVAHTKSHNQMLGRSRDSWGFCGNGQTYHEHRGEVSSGGSNAVWARGDTIVIEVDFDSSTLIGKRNGSVFASVPVDTKQPLFPGISVYFSGEGVSVMSELE